MSRRLYIGGLPFQTTAQELELVFAEVGEVASVRVITDRDTGRSKGFGFVEMVSDDARAAILQLDGVTYQGRRLIVAVARPQEARTGGFGGVRRGSDPGPGGGRRY